MSIKKISLIILDSAIILLLISVSLICLLPPVSRDALTHHLYVPYLYLKHGGIFELPHISFSYYPELLDYLYCIPLYFKNDILPKYIHFSFALFTALFIYLYIKPRLGKLYALTGVLFFLTIPVIFKLSINVYVDLGLVCFTFASIYYLFKWREKSFRYKYLIIAGIYSGLALSVKYNGFVSFFIIVLLIPFLLDDKQKKSIKVIFYPVVFVIVSLTVFSPWMIKNYIWTNNPVYPLYDSVFNARQDKKISPVDNEVYFGKGMNHFVMRKLVYRETFFETITIPVRIFFEGQDDNPKLFDGKLNSFLFLLPLFWIVFRKRCNFRDDKELNFMIWFSVLTVIIVFFKVDMRVRYVAVIIPSLVVVAMTALYSINDFLFKKNKFYLIFILIIVIFLSNFIYIKNQFEKSKVVSYLSGNITNDDYVSFFRPEYRLIQYINKNTANNSKILAVFLGHRGLYFKRDVRFRRDILYYFIKNSDDSEEILNKLLSIGYTHIILRSDLFLNEAKTILSDKAKKRMSNFFNLHCKFLGKSSDYLLYELVDISKKGID